MTHDVRYWLQGEGVQNFGDFLSEYLLRNLFFSQPNQGRDLRIIGSCIDDWFVEPAPLSPSGGALDGAGPIFWGCGLRQEDGLSPERRGSAEILAVRGPLTRSALRLGNTVPVGDPALLLPALHRAVGLWRRSNSPTLIVPHFHEKRDDAELLALTGCSAVLRPNIPNDLTAISEFIDQVAAADFVLCGAMHAAIVAAAYDRPFAFWDSGDVDLPFKWQDFAASVGIPCAFQPDLATARAYHAAAIAPAIRMPVLWPLLVASPLPVRPDAFVNVVAMDVARHGLAALEPGVSSRAANRLRSRLEAVTLAAEAATTLQSEVLARAENEGVLREHVAVLTERVAREETRRREEAARLERLEARQADYEQLRITQAEARVQAARLQDDVARLRGREATLAAEEARLHEAVQARDHALAAGRAEAEARAAQVDAMRRSITWRMTAPFRVAGRRMPWTLALLRLGWWIVTLRLGQQMRRRRHVRGQVALLRRSPLFDAAYYLERHPDLAAAGTDPVTHYVATGAALGYEPCLLFDGSWYAATYADCARSGLSPLVHYVTEGASRGHDPHPLFDTAWYAVHNPAAGPGVEALLHYLREGAAAGAMPNALFDPAGYLSEYPEAQASGLDPLQHFLRRGAGLGYDPHPLFDTGWYAATYPEVAASGMNPLGHYLRVGAAKEYHCTPLQRHIAGFRLDQALAFADWPDPEVSIVIPVYGHLFDTLRCLHSLAAHSVGVGYEVIVLDDRPDNPTTSFLAEIPGLRLHANPGNLGFLRSCNQAKTLARGWHIVFLNNDTLVGADWLEPLLRPVRRDPKVGIVGCKLLNADGSIQEAGGIIFRNGWGFRFGQGEDARVPECNYAREVDVVTGAAFLVRRELFTMLGGFDERYAPAFYEEFDLAFEARRAGFKVEYQPRSEVTHFGSASYGTELRDRQSLRNHAKFCLKWMAELEKQPADDGDLFLARQRPGAPGIILMIDDKVPEYDRHAGALTIFQYVKLLCGLGFRIVFCPADLTARQPYTIVLQDIGIEVLHAPVELAGWLAAHGQHLTVVWTARPDVSAGLLDLVRATTTARILYYPHDLHYLREMRRYQLEGDLWALEESNRLRKLELAIFRAVDCVMTPSVVEAEVIRREVPEATVRVVPPYLYPTRAAVSLDADSFAARRDILFVGGFKHPPNVDAALWLAREIMPLVWRQAPDARLILVGDEPTEAVRALGADTRVEVTGYVPDLAPYFERARASVSPLRYGAGVKGKIVSSLESGIPVVTTAVGNEGIALMDGQEVLLGETAEDLAAAVLRLLRDPALCAALSLAGVMVIQQRFSEDVAREVMQSVLQMDLCRVCGQVSLGAHNVDAPAEGFAEDPWLDRLGCDNCGATDQDQALAGVLLAPLRGKAINSLHAAVPELSRLRIHALGGDGPVLNQLRESARFTHPDALVAREEDSTRSLREGELDLLVNQGEARQPVVITNSVNEAYRVLKPGGRYVLVASEPERRNGTDPAMALREADFDVSVQVARGEEGVTIITATRR
ncbi:glycosyltransferase [Rhodopila sp.]|uniref:glycosyltransferase n=1 Tax=Rhodopila sp. TaxID=2480087 RepID=UPI003D10D9DD